MTTAERNSLEHYLSRHSALLLGRMALDVEELDPEHNEYDWDLVISPSPDEPGDELLAALWHGCVNDLDEAALLDHMRQIPELNDAFNL